MVQVYWVIGRLKLHCGVICSQILERQGAEKAQQKLNAKAAMPLGYGSQYRVAGGMRGGGGGAGPLRGAYHGPGHRQKPYEKPMHAVQQPNNSSSGPVGARDFAQYGEPLIGTCKLILCFTQVHCLIAFVCFISAILFVRVLDK